MARASRWRLTWSLGRARLRRSARPPARANNTVSWSAKRPFTTSGLSPSTTATIPVRLCRNARVSAVQPPEASHTSGRYWTPAARQSASVRLCCRLRRAYWRHANPPACGSHPNGCRPKRSQRQCLTQSVRCCVACYHQGAGRPTRQHLVQDSSCFKLWAELGPLAIVKDQISNAVVEGHMIATCHATRCMATLAVQDFATEAAGPTSTHIDSQATSNCSKKIRPG